MLVSTGNSFNGHRLVAAAGRQGPEVQNRLMEELFKAYFTEVTFLPSHNLHAGSRLSDAGIEGLTGVAARAGQVLQQPRGAARGRQGGWREGRR